MRVDRSRIYELKDMVDGVGEVVQSVCFTVVGVSCAAGSVLVVIWIAAELLGRLFG